MTLAEHLALGARTPFAWGVCDCSLWVADWIAARRGIDPAAHLRGRYATARGARRAVHRAGGMEAMMRDALASAGLSETADPRPGDVALVQGHAGPTMAIRGARGWHLKAPHGIAYGPRTLIQAWSI